MDRNEFLTLAMRYSVGEKARVKYDGAEYYPISYTIGCSGKGTYTHSVRMKDVRAAESYVIAPLEKVERTEDSKSCPDFRAYQPNRKEN